MVNRGLLLDVVVAELSLEVEDVGQQLALEDQVELNMWGDVFLLLDLALHHRDGVVSPDVQGDRLAHEVLHEDLEIVPSTDYGLLHYADVQDAILHFADVLGVVKELHLIVYYLVVFNGVVVSVVDSILIIIGSK